VKIGIVTEYYFPLLGGITEHVHNTRLRLSELGHEVKVITSNSNLGIFRARGALDSIDPDVIRLGFSAPVFANGSVGDFSIGFGLGGKLKAVFDAEQFDLLHVHSPIFPTLPLLAVLRSACPVVGTFHTYFDGSVALSTMKRLIQSRIIDRLDGQIAVSESCVTALRPYCTLRATVIPNGVDTEEFNPTRKRLEMFEEKTPTLLFVGRFDPRNGLAVMLRAFDIVRRRFPSARLIVVGSGPLRWYYKALVSRESRSHIHFAGLVRGERPAFYATCDVFCSPVSKASFGLTLLEAMASGKPIVATENVGYLEILSEKEAILTPPGDPEAFANGIIRLLEDRKLREEMGSNGREKALGYSWDKVIQDIEGCYKKALGVK
jgi:phosphatidylinositol alpha-mannosyltransferase